MFNTPLNTSEKYFSHVRETLNKIKPINLINLIGQLWHAKTTAKRLSILTAISELYGMFWPDKPNEWLVDLVLKLLDKLNEDPDGRDNPLTDDDVSSVKSYVSCQSSTHPSMPALEQLESFDDFKPGGSKFGLMVGAVLALIGLASLNGTTSKFVIPSLTMAFMTQASFFIKNLDTLLHTFPKLVESIKTLIYNNMGLQHLTENGSALQRVDSVFTQLRTFATELDNKGPLILPDRKKLADLKREVDELRKDMITRNSNKDPTVGKMMGDTLDMYNKIMTRLDHLLEMLPFRQFPIVVVLAGDPGVGKTDFAKHLATELTKTKDYPNGNYECMNLDIDHFDSYRNSQAVIIEDFGKTCLKKDMQMLQNLSDSSPYFLNADQIENKRMMFTSEVIIITTNVEDLFSPEVPYGEALARRIQVHMSVENPQLKAFIDRTKSHPHRKEDLVQVYSKDFSHLKMFKLPQQARNLRDGRLELLPIGVVNLSRDLLKVKRDEFELRVKSSNIKLTPLLKMEAANSPVVLLMGHPGAGKSTMARKVVGKRTAILCDDFVSTEEEYRAAFKKIKDVENSKDDTLIILTANPQNKLKLEKTLSRDLVDALNRKVTLTYTFEFRKKGWLEHYTHHDLMKKPDEYDSIIKILDEEGETVPSGVALQNILDLAGDPVEDILDEVPFIKEFNVTHHVSFPQKLMSYRGLSATEGLRAIYSSKTNVPITVLASLASGIVTQIATEKPLLVDVVDIIKFLNAKGVKTPLDGVVEFNTLDCRFFCACSPGKSMFCFLEGEHTNVSVRKGKYYVERPVHVRMPESVIKVLKEDVEITNVSALPAQHIHPEFSWLDTLQFAIQLITAGGAAVSLVTQDHEAPARYVKNLKEYEMSRRISKEEYDKLVMSGALSSNKKYFDPNHKDDYYDMPEPEDDDTWAGRHRYVDYGEIIEFESNPIIEQIRSAIVPMSVGGVRIGWGLRSGDKLVCNTHVARMATHWHTHSIAETKVGPKKTRRLTDTTVITLNSSVPKARDISKHFLNTSSVVPAGCPAFVCADGASLILPATIEVFGVHSLADHKITGYAMVPTKTMAVATPIRNMSQKGDCGSPIIAGVGGDLKIIGLHSGSGSGRMFCSVLNSDLFSSLESGTGGIEVVQIMTNKERVAGRTNLYRSPLSSPDSQLTKEPCVLSPLDPRAPKPKTYSQLLNDQIEKYNTADVVLNDSLVDSCVEELADWLHQKMVNKNYTLEPLSFPDALNSIDFATGPGYEFTQRGVTSKGQMVSQGENGRYKVNGPKAKVFVDLYGELDIATKLIQGRYEPLFMAALKDEVLPIEKIYNINKFKTRAIIASPMHFTVLGRQLTGKFYDFFTSFPGTTPVCVGVNPHSEIWDELANKLLKGSRWCDIDFSRWDATQSLKMMEAVDEVIEKTYQKFGHCIFQMQRFHQIAETPLVVVDNKICRFHRGMISGRPGTSVNNSLAHIIYLTLFMKENFGPHHSVDSILEEFHLCVYGDDVVMGVPDWFKETELMMLVDFYRNSGLVPTDSSKSGDPIFKTFDEIQLIKRKFRFENGRFWAPLEEESIFQQLEFQRGPGRHDWWREKNMCVDACQENLANLISNVMLESHHHGEGFYTDMKNLIMKRAAIRGIEIPVIPSFPVLDLYLRSGVCLSPSGNKRNLVKELDCVLAKKAFQLESGMSCLQTLVNLSLRTKTPLNVDSWQTEASSGSWRSVVTYGQMVENGIGIDQESAVEIACMTILDQSQPMDVDEPCSVKKKMKIPSKPPQMLGLDVSPSQQLNDLKTSLGVPTREEYTRKLEGFDCSYSFGKMCVTASGSSKKSAKNRACKKIVDEIYKIVKPPQLESTLDNSPEVDDSDFVYVDDMIPEKKWVGLLALGTLVLSFLMVCVNYLTSMLTLKGEFESGGVPETGGKPTQPAGGEALPGIPGGTVITGNPSIDVVSQPTPGMAVTGATAGSSNAIDPMIFATFAACPEGNFTISSTQTIGTPLWTAKCDPNLNLWTSYLSKMYNAWAGGFELQFIIAANAFTAGKLVMAYLPPQIEPSEVFGDDILCYPHVIIDVREPQDICMKLNDIRNVLWHRVGDTTVNGFGGWVTIRVLNTLRGSSDLPYTVQARILSRPEPEFDFAFLVAPTRQIITPVANFADEIDLAFSLPRVGGNMNRLITGMKSLPSTQQSVTNQSTGICGFGGSYLNGGSSVGTSSGIGAVYISGTQIQYFYNDDGTQTTLRPNWIPDGVMAKTWGNDPLYLLDAKGNVSYGNFDEVYQFAIAPGPHGVADGVGTLTVSLAGLEPNSKFDQANWTIPYSGESLITFTLGQGETYNSYTTRAWNDLCLSKRFSTIPPGYAILCVIWDPLNEIAVGLAKIYPNGVVTTAATESSVVFGDMTLRYLSLAPESTRPGVMTARTFGYTGDIALLRA